MLVAMIMAAVPMMTAVPTTTPAAPVPCASRVTQLEPTEVVLSERLCGYLLRRTGVRQRSRAPSAEIERGDGPKEPGKKISPIHSAPTVGSRVASAALKRLLRSCSTCFHVQMQSCSGPPRGRRPRTAGDPPARFFRTLGQLLQLSLLAASLPLLPHRWRSNTTAPPRAGSSSRRLHRPPHPSDHPRRPGPSTRGALGAPQLQGLLRG
jgi:hypothetical protein